MAGAAWSCARARLRSWLIDETWAVGIVDRPIASFIDRPTLADARWLPVPPGGYMADPFGLPEGDAILVERFDHMSAVGRLAIIAAEDGAERMADPLRPTPRGHASFPSLVSGEGALWCLPETVADGRLVLWRRRADGRFRPCTVIAEGLAAVDPVLFPWEGRWWIAFTDGRAGSHDNLHLLYAERPQGPWLPHAGNPVRRGDPGASRSAGTPFPHEGRLYRPAQDCTTRYGAAVVLNCVLRLDPDGFTEATAARIAPNRRSPFPHGTHTLSAWGRRTLVDAKREGFVPAAFRRRVALRLQALARLGRRPAAPGGVVGS